VFLIIGIDTGVDGSCEAIAKYLGDRKADIVVCNSGILRYDDIDRIDLEGFKEQLNVNTLGPLRAFTALQKNFKAGSKYCIISSRFGSIDDNSSGKYYGYRTSKTAVNMVGKCLSIDAKKDGVIVGLLHPGFVETDMTKGSTDKTGMITATESVSGMTHVIDKLTLEVTGQFWHPKGTNLPW